MVTEWLVPETKVCPHPQALPGASATPLVPGVWSLPKRGPDSLIPQACLGDFPGGLVAKTPHSQCKGLGFNPWSEN